MSKTNPNHDKYRLTDDENFVRLAVCGHNPHKACQRFQFCEDRPLSCDEFRAGMRVLQRIRKGEMRTRKRCDGWGRNKCDEPATHKVLHYMGYKELGVVCKKHEKMARRYWATEPMARKPEQKEGERK